MLSVKSKYKYNNKNLSLQKWFPVNSPERDAQSNFSLHSLPQGKYSILKVLHLSYFLDGASSVYINSINK